MTSRIVLTNQKDSLVIKMPIAAGKKQKSSVIPMPGIPPIITEPGRDIISPNLNKQIKQF
jgi:hypothetical protein